MTTQQAGFAGYFFFRLRDHGVIIAERRLKNAPVNVGLNSILDVMFHGATQITAWSFGLIDNAGFAALAAGDTMSSHAGWNELTSYDEAARQAWVEGAPSGQVIANLAADNAVFTATGAISVKGAFLTSSSTKGGTTGTLWATAIESSALAVANGQTLEVGYQLTAAAG